MAHVTATIPSVTDLFAGVLTATTVVITASTSVGLPGVLGWQDELPPP